MVKVDIFRDKTAGCDIVIIDTEEYISGIVFDHILQHLRIHASRKILDSWNFFENEDESAAQSCLQYKGIAIRLNTFLNDRSSSKNEFKILTEEALQNLN